MRRSVKDFAEIMEQKLVENDHKSGWDKCHTCYLIRRIREEVKELEDAVIFASKKPEDINREAADVANFAMMLAERYKTIYENKQKRGIKK